MLLPPTPHEEMILLQMKNLAVQCERETNPEDIYDRCVTAFELVNDLRGEPRTDTEKMLRREWGNQVDLCLRGDGFESIAYRMMPHYRQKPNGAMSRFGLALGNPPGSKADELTYPSATITHPFTGDEVIGVGPTLSMSLLAAVLRAHVEWHDFWQTGYYENDDGREQADEG